MVKDFLDDLDKKENAPKPGDSPSTPLVNASLASGGTPKPFKTAEAPAADSKKSSSSDAPGKVSFIGEQSENEYAISVDKPLSVFDSSSGKAYSTIIRMSASFSSADHFTLLCKADASPRMALANLMRSQGNTGMMWPVDWGKVLWPEDNTEYLGLVFHAPSPKKLMDTLDHSFVPFNEEQIRQFIVTILPGLQHLAAAKQAHRAIRPTNIYYADVGARTLVLGECISSLPALNQPSIFEPIESAMCTPFGRGSGTIADDIFALGITALFMYLGQHPFHTKQRTAEEMATDFFENKSREFLYNRIHHGTLFSLTSTIKLSVRMSSLLNGILEDDPKRRWNLEQLETWAGGRNPQAPRPARINRSRDYLQFAGTNYFSLRSVLHGFTEYPHEAIDKLYTTEYDPWFNKRGREEGFDISVQKLFDPFRSSSSAQRLSADSHLARIAMLIDPAAPIRYKKTSLLPSGIPGAILPLIKLERETIIREIVKSDLLTYWLQVNNQYLQQEEAVSLSETGKSPERIYIEKISEMNTLLKQFLNEPFFGSGIELALYTLNPDMACASVLFEKCYIRQLSEIIPHLERKFERDKNFNPIDRHLAAFIIARGAVPAHWLKDIRMLDDEPTKFITMLRLLSYAQDNTASRFPAPHLSHWFGAQLERNIKFFESKSRKKKLMKKAERAMKEGSLKSILEVVDDESEKMKDKHDFSEAKTKYVTLEKRIMINKQKQKLYMLPYHPLGPKIANLISFLALVGVVYYTIWM